MTLGMTASAASAHKHEFSAPTVPGPSGQDAMNQDQPFLHPLQYLHARLQAITTACVAVVSPTTPTETRNVETDGNTGNVSLRTSLETCSSTQSHTESHNTGLPITNGAKSLVKVPTTKTSYLLSHPAPRVRSHRILNKNRMLLQLRKLSSDRSPAPALEIFPGSAFPRSMSKRLSHTLRDHHALNGSDLVVLNCQSYHPGAHDEEDGELVDEEQLDLGRRDVVGCIHLGEGDGSELEAEISLGSSQWTVSKFDKGRYEFKGTDDEGNELLARWWIKHSSKRARRSSVMSTGEMAVDRKFNFSILRNGTRRHPIVGRMDQTSIEVFDQYKIPDSPNASQVASPSAEGFSPLSLGDGGRKSYFNSAYPAANTTVETSADLRKLMLVTGLWVAIAEGWSMAANSHFETRCLTSTPHSNPSSLRTRNTSGRTFSTDLATDVAQSSNGSRARIPSWPHRHSASTTTPDSPILRGTFPHRSNTIAALTGSMRKKKSGFFGKESHSPLAIEDVDEVHHRSESHATNSISIQDDNFSSTVEDSIVSESLENVQIGSDASFNGHLDNPRSFRGMVKRSKSRSEKTGKRERLLGMLQRKKV